MLHSCNIHPILQQMDTKYTNCCCGSNEIKVNLPYFPPSQQVERIHSILEIMHESRFGPNTYQRYIGIDFDENWYEPLGCEDYDLMPLSATPYPVDIRPGSEFKLSGSCDVAVTSDHCSTSDSVFIASSNALPHHSPSTLARGSPKSNLFVHH
jgi:hypothetical protein